MSFCEIILVGNCGREPELRFTTTGTAVCDFSLAVNKRVKQGDEWVDETTWFKITVWGADGERANQYLEKGKQVLIVGDRVEARTYQTQGGETRVSLEVTARKVQFLGSRSESPADSGSEEQPF
jgi:single-strand DNA-binding protein